MNRFLNAETRRARRYAEKNFEIFAELRDLRVSALLINRHP